MNARYPLVPKMSRLHLLREAIPSLPELGGYNVAKFLQVLQALLQGLDCRSPGFLCLTFSTQSWETNFSGYSP
jgi:hypothetical protein